MKILQLISSGGYYGIEHMLMNLTTALGKLRHQCVIGIFHNMHRPNTEFGDVARRQGIPVETIICRRQVDWGAVRAVKQYIAKHDVDVIHTHGYKADVYGYFAARQLGKPIVATYHSSPLQTARLRLYTRLDHVLLRRFDAVVAISRERCGALHEFGVPSGKITTIWNGIDVSTFRNAMPALAGASAKREGKVVGVVGRLVPEKGVQFLLYAASEVVTRYPDTLFLVVGGGPQRTELEELARDLGIQGNVRFLGQRRDMPEIYAAMDIFVLPSFDEGLPMCVLEAQAAGKPVIGTAVGGTPDVVRHNQNGILVEPKEISGLRDGMLQLLGDSDLRTQLGRNGQAWVEKHFSADVMAARYRKFYDQVLEQHQAA